MTEIDGREALRELDPMAMQVLKNNQRQLDMDGVEVGVSRQALDMLIEAYDAIAATVEALEKERDAMQALARAYEAEANQMREVSGMSRRRAEAAEARVSQLREVLSHIANAFTAHTYSDAMDAVQVLKDMAKEALDADR